MAENVYTVSLARAYEENRRERTIKAVEILRRFLARHSKVEEENVKISNDLNSLVWGHGMQRPPRTVKVVTVRDEKGNVVADLFKDQKELEKKPKKEKKKTKKEIVKKTEEPKVVEKPVKKEEPVEKKKEVKAEEKKEVKKTEKKEVKGKAKTAKGRGKE